jgi:hypothetical protein
VPARDWKNFEVGDKLDVFDVSDAFSRINRTTSGR